MSTTSKTLVLALFVLLASTLFADQGRLTNSGGSTSVTAGITVTSTVAAPAGSLNLHCPVVSPGACAGGSFSFSSTDGTVSITASFSSGRFVESCYGGGRGGHITCYYSFTGNISGTVTVNGVTQAIIGATSQQFKPGGAAASGSSFYNSAYSPFYYSDTEQILRSDDLEGTNQISFGSGGSGVGQFYGAYGVALDSTGRIYVADTYNCRIVRIDDMSGANWTSLGDGTCGSGQGEFNEPWGIAVDPAGKIYVMDTGNTRLVSMDDMSGTNWATFGSVGSGVGQFSSFTSVAVDSSGRIYVPDTGNLRLVRMDDMTGANWTTLSQIPPVNGVPQLLESPVGVAFDSQGRIYIADNRVPQPVVVRVDDMTGTNWTTSIPIASLGINSVAVDSGGTVFVGGGGVHLVDGMAGVLSSSGAVAPFGTYYVFGINAVPVPSPLPSALTFSPDTLTFGTQDIGTTSSSQAVNITNFGGSPLNFSAISASDQFVETTNCPNSLAAGASCTVNVSLAPTVTGSLSGQLTLSDDSGNLGGTQTVALSGTGSMPRLLSVSPAQLNFANYTIGDNPRQTVTITNTSSAAVAIAGIALNGDPSFTQTNNCPAAVAAGASCSVAVTFTPTAYGTFTSTLTVTQSSGAQETAAVTGTALPDD
ncbi:MAG TPA: choice-of-anchor D domain-containing protein [Terriglobales bacterium]|jgi:sugar lactone lactonase YvrE|nr:choice-of-anchor D domain-containing protein [Terriglobales bacterium]